MREFRDDVVDATTMKRRSFLTLLGMAGVAAALPIEALIPEPAAAQVLVDPGVIEPGDFWIMDWFTGKQVKLGELRNVTVRRDHGFDVFQRLDGETCVIQGLREPDTLSVEVEKLFMPGLLLLRDGMEGRRRTTVGVHAFGKIANLTMPSCFIRQYSTDFGMQGDRCEVEFIAIEPSRWDFS